MAMLQDTKDKIKAAADAKKAAKTILIDSLHRGELHALPDFFIDALKIAIAYKAPKEYTKRSPNGKSRMQRATLHLLEHRSASTLDLFQLFSLGRYEMGRLRRQLASLRPPEGRVYISLEGEEWKVVGEGPEVPDEYLVGTK